ncbi:MAG TPA: ATP-binding protein [Bacteroidales bacterium]|nr:ATP-binding protein [Bacteroidales bacterium]HQI46475.1 ATP-binding protein [Bacteroidales bacterium]
MFNKTIKMIKKILNQQQEEQQFLLHQEYIQRLDADVKSELLKTSLIKVITGPRRAGKSVMALQLLKEKKFAYLNFDDDALLKQFDEDEILQGLYQVYSGFEYLLLDEIQNLKRWELWVNKLYRRGINMVITGSNSRLLSHELASSLTGRYIQITVLPFSFSEVMRFTNPSIIFKKQETPIEKGKLLALLQNYLFNGGFPETLLNQGILKNYLSSLFDSILLKDVLKRFRVRQTQQLYDLSNYMLSNYTNYFTFNQVKESLDFNSVATVQKFVGYLEEPYLFQHLTRYDTKIKNQQKAAQKIYIIDNGFVKARSFELSPNYGRLLENLVFVELLRRHYQPGLNLFYYRTRNNHEIDFLLRRGNRIEQLIQVCFSIDQSKTIKRELNALIEASQELKCSKLLLITWDKEEVIEQKNLKIEVVPAYKWLTEYSEKNKQ